MKRVGSVVVVACILLVVIGMLAQSALADGITTYSATELTQEGGDNPANSVLQNCYDQVGDHASNVDPTPYRTVGDLSIDLDYYAARNGQAPYPAVVLVHGGGWVGGCRDELDALANKISGHGYVVFNIDYRLSCSDSEVPICGFNLAAEPDDVDTAISWVRDSTQESEYDLSGEVAAVGTSAGGNLVFEVGSTATGDDRPDVVAGISGIPEMGYMSDGNWACDEAYIPPGKSNLCETNAELYINHAGPQGSVSQCAGNSWDWKAASAFCQVASGAPAMFIGNATEELSPWQSAGDFANKLSILPVAYQFCSVGTDTGNHSYRHYHGSHLLNPNIDCDSPQTGSVFDNMMAFIASHI